MYIRPSATDLNGSELGIKPSDSSGKLEERTVTHETGGWLSEMLNWICQCLSSWLSSSHVDTSGLQTKVSNKPPLIGYEYSDFLVYQLTGKRPFPRYETPKEALEKRISQVKDLSEISQIRKDIEGTDDIYFKKGEKEALIKSFNLLKYQNLINKTASPQAINEILSGQGQGLKMDSCSGEERRTVFKIAKNRLEQLLPEDEGRKKFVRDLDADKFPYLKAMTDLVNDWR